MDEKQRYFYSPSYTQFKENRAKKTVNKMDAEAVFDEGKDWIHNYMLEYDDQQYGKDVEYLQGLYPPMSRDILDKVREECDKHEYEGSVMFDEYPDQVGVNKILDNIYESVKYMSDMFKPVMEEDDDLRAMGYCASCRGKDDWLRNLVSVILFDEMHHRRRRYYKHRRRYY